VLKSAPLKENIINRNHKANRDKIMEQIKNGAKVKNTA